MTDESEFLARWRKAYAEAFPSRNAEAMRYHDATLAGLLMLEREFDAKLEAVHSTAAKNLRLDRIDRSDPKAPE